jgi:Zn-finger nucleic acid-binding protein
MESVTLHSVTVDRCMGCGGMWFDAYEADKLRGVKGSDELDRGDPDVGKKYNKVEDIDCPKCNVGMIRMVDAGQRHIYYESCPMCFGVYFDAGEFKDYKDESFWDFFKGLFSGERK